MEASPKTERAGAARAPSSASRSAALRVGRRRRSVAAASNARQERETTFRRMLGLADATALISVLGLISAGSGGVRLGPIVLLIPFAFVAVAKAMGLYDRDENLLHKTTLDEVPKLAALATVAALLLSLSGSSVLLESVGPSQVFLGWASLFVALIALRAVARRLARAITPAERVLFVGDSASATEFAERLTATPAVKAEVVGWIEASAPVGSPLGPAGWLGLSTAIQEEIGRCDAHRVLLGPGANHSEELLDSIRTARTHGVKLSVLADLSRVVSAASELDRLDGTTLVGVRRYSITRSSQLLKRGFDIFSAGLALVLLGPVIAIAALAVRLDSNGPVVFRQPRAGRYGRPFQMLKLRSMVEGADEMKQDLLHLSEADGVFKIANDPRITRVGGMIRRLHIDELPQLVNVLRGDMSMVGPRPLPLEEDRQITGWHRRRLDVRPGITGPWQVLGSSRVPLREMVKLDYQYVADWSLWNDFKILLLTAGRVVRRGGM